MYLYASKTDIIIHIYQKHINHINIGDRVHFM